MNERIEHCLYQAGLTAQGCWDQLGTYEQQAIERFAQLIVQECAEVAGCNGHVSGFTLGDLIKEHFGVEE